MANLTVSTDVDSFMQAANNAAARTSLGAPAATTTITAGTGLTGGGDLSANRTLAVSYGTTAGTAAQGNDSRLSNARTPTAHAATHAANGSDPVTVTLTSQVTGTLAVGNGGTGVTASSGANSVVLRDASQNVTVNSVIEGFTSIAASGTQLVLTVASAPSYLVTGSGGQTIKLPDATTLQNGVVFLFNNNQSSGAIAVNNNSNTLVAAIPSGGFSTITLLDNSTAAGSWERHEMAPSNASWSTNTLDYAGSITNATWNGNTVAVNRGGTGQTVYTDGQLLIGNSTGNTLAKATLTAGDGITITNGAGSISIAKSTATQTATQVFTSSGTWTKPAGAKSVHIIAIGGGGGGGSGRASASGTAAGGGGGGGSSGRTITTLDAALLGATETVTVGAGNAGGAARPVGSDGLSGTAGGSTSLGLWAWAGNGNPGGGGTAIAGGTAGGGATRALFTGATGGLASASFLVGTTGGNASSSGGGGGGGGVTSGGAAALGGVGGFSFLYNGGGVGQTPVGQAGTSVPANTPYGGNGGGGGNASTSAIAMSGGAGGIYGAGGGGGGASQGFDSGAGGPGAQGILVITTYF